MKTRYSRNRIYITEAEQQIIKKTPVILGGSGIGSNIAECALRLGFENITIIDGDQVEDSNLNRQNYTEADIATDKTLAIKSRLEAINSNANIVVHNCFLTHENLEEFIKGHKIAINALDFTSDVPLIFDKLCQSQNISVLHPYNLGWGGLLTVITPDSLTLETLNKQPENISEVNMVEYASNYLKFWGTPHLWIDDILESYKNEEGNLPPPQLAIASWIVAAMCTHVLFKIATGKEFKKFPEFYLSTLMND
ncbi:ThiF family adenylyltransferase [Kordia algicida OT-1]|uniref:UBA/THIF-type NAD/FAD binding protein n=1 Tax=Kordia algicida OT-1 TaxID=391587 RepID=A9DYJ7_9FLAO|nr:ThiF family adenylyltransferase [Kordia algicida]EDP96142.1 UBA/THIF-type NAD/FAD binding protein [Kordia algicida OT-1]